MPSQNTENPFPGQTPQVVHLRAGDLGSGVHVAQQFIQLPITVAEKSSYLRARIPSSSKHGDTIVVGVPVVEPAALKLYAWWLQFGDAPLFLHDETGPVSQPRRSLIWRECFDLIQAHILGSRFDDANFQRYILGQFDQWLAPQQEPDLELLDYLWEIERAFVGEELLCFVMGHMFHMEASRVRVLVAWMTGLNRGRRMMDSIEGTGSSRRQDIGASTTRTRKASDTYPNQMEGAGQEAASRSVTEEVAAAQRTLGREPVYRDKTPCSLYGEARSEIRHPPYTIQWVSDGVVAAPMSRRSQYRKDAPAPRPGSLAIPRKPTRLARMQSSSQDQFGHLPQALRLHPKALASIANTNMHAELERQRTSSPHLPPSPSLHPVIREGLANSATEPGPQEKHPEMRGGAYSIASLGGNIRTIAAIPDTSLQLLDFWTDPSPSDLPGPNFWADLPTDTRPPVPPKDKPAAFPSARFPPLSPPYSQSPTTKQFIQSFTLTRTPTPRRRATRSWSVASIRSLEAEEPVRKRSVIDRPGRGLISRRPVPEGGLKFLSKYMDGERLKRIVSVNSRPRRMDFARGSGSRDGDEVWERGWEVRRPGTA
ncbi:uncharacterized protein N0V89_010220 [Didymosphaeria variabile]|uniref:Uncharacterized protein n=1 Tax=Didymosphaeria variabile TaxID=1932322 RepID=A0A9W8XFB7_9PLEO|nr:uncharacterized protein N0V89_010220 [Didymosphaeria variabile]KAJ4348842.1 hypothetical protein N0V89_010220 [Didymosphaeria variabile]